MPAIIIPALPDEIHCALRARAMMRGRSIEAEIRVILEETVRSEGRIKLGSLLFDIARRACVTNEDIEILEQKLADSRTAP
ncbi:Arc family DNA-binding protein [Mesorhizobium sp. WSM4884]|uniref:FitA-like ribbon-helix-helix domain-containing protein n=1 Tax=Mesorhizobium sp. WSM4884 TaxID=3038542 RepID=UPI002415CCA8|nr:Arc family DNA-binding protein [Mesorhizobium sp. WSM4884]MDG4883915.1 Arc family DNA-binding protein [Mesorhizobium sp. WSM4884]